MFQLRWWINIAILFGITYAEQQNHQRRSQLRSDPTSPVRSLQNINSSNDTAAYFRITVVGTIMEAEVGRFRLSDELDNISCIPIIDGKESHHLYSINLPNSFVNKHADLISIGKLFVAITNTRIIEKEQRVVVTKNSTISIAGNTRSDDGSTDHAATTGQKTLAVVRISTRDSTPTHDAQTIQTTLFNPNTVNLRTQYMNCSFGQLEWVLAPGGVVEVFVDQPIADFTTGSSLVTAAQDVMTETMGIDPSTLGDKVMMCLPPGTGGWIASSGVNHWRSQFNDEWCLSLTATMHEIGHMLGLIHSNEDGVAYGDSTDYMAAGHKDYDWPRKCFNGYKNWQLGWYEERQLSLESTSFDEGHLLKLASFVDFQRADYDEHVLIIVANELYLEFNLARDFNIDTEEKRNQVTITAPGESGSESLAGLKEQEAYRVSNFHNSNKELVVEVCTRDRGKLGAYMMWISIAFGKSLCDEVEADNVVKGYQLEIEMSESPSAAPTRKPVTQSPTPLPTQRRSDSPSEMPSFVPSANPTTIPTRTPSNTPSFSPSNIPTIIPSNGPTSLPTVSPAPSTGSVSIFPETAEPTPQPKIDYQELLRKRESKINDSVTVKLNELESLFNGGNR